MVRKRTFLKKRRCMLEWICPTKRKLFKSRINCSFLSSNSLFCKAMDLSFHLYFGLFTLLQLFENKFLFWPRLDTSRDHGGTDSCQYDQQMRKCKSLQHISKLPTTNFVARRVGQARCNTRNSTQVQCNNVVKQVKQKCCSYYITF